VRRVCLLLLCAGLGVAACERRAPEVFRPVPEVVPPAPAAQTIDPTAPAAEQFAAVRTASGGAPTVIGAYTRGCVAGAEQLALAAPRWLVLHPSRNRAWGHPALIRFLQSLADGVAVDGYRGLLVGDLAQPRGGPLPSDHNSHQVGLDADVWLTPMPAQPINVETFEPPSMVDFDRLRVNRLFGAAQMSMLERAATASDVERIFVSPPIKRALCERATGERGWLRKIRPWFGHSAHMHVRLACPSGSTSCVPQAPPPEGEGCGAELQSWLDDRSWLHRPVRPYDPDAALKLDALPGECRRVLAAG